MSVLKTMTIALLMIGFVGLSACDAEKAEGDKDKSADKKGPSTTSKILNADDALAAQQAAQQMLVLAQAGDWSTLIDQYYAEADKSEPGAKKQLVSLLEGGLGQQMIDVLERAKQVRPTVEGEDAVFKEDGQPFYKLRSMGKGKWGFTL